MNRVYGYWIFGALLAVLVAAALLIYFGPEQNEGRVPERQPSRLGQEAGSPQQGAGTESAKPFSLVTTFKGDPKTSRAFTWHTASTEAASVLQVVQDTGNASFEGAGVRTFQGTTTVLKLIDGSSQGVHKTEAVGLEPGTGYRYRVGDGSAEGWSEPAAFTTEPAKTDAFTFLNVTDSQGVTERDFELWKRTLDKAFGLFPDAAFIVHNGDMTENPDDPEAWKHLLGKARPWVASYPLMPVTGNHEQVDKKADAFVLHFMVPDNGSPSSIPGTSYSFDYGPVHFVMLNSESKLKEQAAWLEKDLKATDKLWTIVSIHRPAYGGNQDKSVLKHWVPVFDKYGVDLVLQGHNHEYSRSYPLQEGRIVESGGTVYVTLNTSGPKFNKKKDDQFYHRVHFQNGNQMFAAIRIQGDTLSYQAYDVKGKLMDSFDLKRK
ncbi:fibronectin type III domain-containing protein [Paenibacillus sp. GCM10012303]|uniref:fibronectin type III domain-containing protein n=1 Tax=Paenibacillus sp. GCM10012303 TaxID=3317340 RepID=UPI00360CFF83